MALPCVLKLQPPVHTALKVTTVGHKFSLGKNWIFPSQVKVLLRGIKTSN